MTIRITFKCIGTQLSWSRPIKEYCYSNNNFLLLFLVWLDTILQAEQERLFGKIYFTFTVAFLSGNLAINIDRFDVQQAAAPTPYKQQVANNYILSQGKQRKDRLAVSCWTQNTTSHFYNKLRIRGVVFCLFITLGLLGLFILSTG